MLKSLRSSADTQVPLLGSICLALFLLLAFTVWEAFNGVQSIRNDYLRLMVSDLRQGAERNIGRMEHTLSLEHSSDLTKLNQGNWLRNAWSKTGPQPMGELYWAITDAEGRIVWHSNPDLEGGNLGRGWYFRKLPQVGENVVETSSEYLTSGVPSIDLALPIYAKDSTQAVGEYVAEYHVGIPLSNAEQAVSKQVREFLLLRGVLFGGMLIVVILAAAALYQLADRISTLRQVVTSSVAEQAAQLSRLAGGLAHEIRNPLHALRLNLHTFRRAQFDKSLLTEAEVATMLEESNREVLRIENLMNELGSFTTSEEPRNEKFDLTTEVEGIVEFLKHEMTRKSVELEVHGQQESLTVAMDPGRLRQIMLNLIQNSVDAMPEGGKIDISIASRRGSACMLIADNGPGIPEADHQRVFEPFYTNKPDGTGLGLALVRRFVREAGGMIRCQDSQENGAAFNVTFPIARGKGK